MACMALSEWQKPQADLVLRGGAASGVVYPCLVARLAQHYRLRCIGGASAGAIAAGIAAAAQFGVLNGNPKAFRDLRDIPEAMRKPAGGTTRLEHLFSPGPGKEPLGRLRRALFQAGSPARLLTAEAGELLGHAPVVLAVLTGSALLPLALGHALPAPSAGAVVALFLLMLLLALASFLGIFGLLMGRRMRRRYLPPGILEKLRATGFGICDGVDPDLWQQTPKCQQMPKLEDLEAAGHLSDWLHAAIQKAAGLPLDQPLTMGQLWCGHNGAASPTTAWDRPRVIDLVLTTTNLSHQVPHRFPFLEKPGLRLYFREDELARVLPPPVVKAMVAATKGAACEHSASGDPGREKLAPLQVIARDGATYWRLPRPEQLPVLLGVRMSLSFPVLISAVPLWAWRHDDSTHNAGERDQHGPVLRPCLFSDGGITSNFPVTMFDGLLPNRPTFGVNLADVLPDGSSERIELQVDDPSGDPRTGRPPRIAPEWRADLVAGGLGTFLGSILDTARNAHENELMTMPTCRPRIVTVRLDPRTEGGLNLEMSRDTITALAERGEMAAQRLLDHYPPPGAGDRSSWRAHRELRLRKALAALESALVDFHEAWNDRTPGQPGWRQTLATLASRDIPQRGRRRTGLILATQLVQLASDVARAARRPHKSFFDGARNLEDPTSLNRLRQAPRPRMGLRLVPTGSQDPLQG
ncbi:MAG: hypothetical protein SNJ63_02580 [Sphingomonadaceae bacterium]